MDQLENWPTFGDHTCDHDEPAPPEAGPQYIDTIYATTILYTESIVEHACALLAVSAQAVKVPADFKDISEVINSIESLSPELVLFGGWWIPYAQDFLAHGFQFVHIMVDEDHVGGAGDPRVVLFRLADIYDHVRVTGAPLWAFEHILTSVGQKTQINPLHAELFVEAVVADGVICDEKLCAVKGIRGFDMLDNYVTTAAAERIRIDAEVAAAPVIESELGQIIMTNVRPELVWRRRPGCFVATMISDGSQFIMSIAAPPGKEIPALTSSSCFIARGVV